MTNIRRLSFTLIGICAFLLLSKPLSTFLTKLNDYHSGLQTEVIRALENSSAPLEIAFNYVKLNDTFQQNLTWNLKNSIEGHLTGLIKDGQVDDIRLLSPDCQTRFASNTKISINPLPCQAVKQGGSLLWKNDKDALIYSLSGKSLDGATPMYALVSVKIASNWFNVHSISTDVSENWKFPALPSKSNPKFGIFTLKLASGIEGFNQVDVEAPMPYFKIIKINPLTIVNALEKANDFGLFFILMGIIAYFFTVKNYVKIKASEDDYVKKTLQTLLGDEENAVNSPINESTSPQTHALPKMSVEKDQNIVDLIQQVEMRSREQKNEHLKITSLLRQQLSAKEKHITEIRLEKDFFEDLAINNILSKSLHIRLAKFLKALVRKISHFTEEPQIMADILENSIVKKVDEFNEQLKTWDEDISLRGSRKFIRSLAESQPINPKFENKLSEVLQEFIGDHRSLGTELEKLHKKILSFRELPTSMVSIILATMYFFTEEEKSRNIKSSLRQILDKSQQETSLLFPQKVTFLSNSNHLKQLDNFNYLDYVTTAIFSHIFSFMTLNDVTSLEPIIISIKIHQNTPVVIVSRKIQKISATESQESKSEKTFDYRLAEVLCRHLVATLEYIPSGENLVFIVRLPQNDAKSIAKDLSKLASTLGKSNQVGPLTVNLGEQRAEAENSYSPQ